MISFLKISSQFIPGTYIYLFYTHVKYSLDYIMRNSIIECFLQNTSSSLPWSTEKREYEDRGLSPPPAKRARSMERGAGTPDRGRSPSRGNGDMQESLLGQALEGPTPKEVRNSIFQSKFHGKIKSLKVRFFQ